MATATRTLQVSIVGDPSSLSRAFKKVDQDASRLGNSMGKTMKALKYGAVGAAAAIGGGLAVAIKTGISEMMAAQKVSAQTAAVLKSTGQAAGVTQKQVEGLAGQLQNLTGISDDQIQSAQNMLLTFTSISKDVFPRTTRAAVDLSVAFGQSLQSSAIMLGKALQDPIKGVSALSRVGVSFTEQEKAKIKTLVESGKQLEAQRLILKAVEAQVKGSGEAYGKTLPGQLERLKRKFEDITQSVAERFAPQLQSATNVVLTKFAPAVESLVNDLGNIAAADIPIGRKLELALKRLDQTGVPDAVRDTIEKGIIAAATNGPRLLIDGFINAPWQGQAVLAALLIKKFGPALKLAGAGLNKALGGIGGVAAGKYGGATPVWVVNNATAGVGGVPGGAGKGGGIGGFAKRYGPLAAPGLAGGSAASLLAMFGAPILGGMGLNELQKNGALEKIGLGGLFPSNETLKKRAREGMNAFVLEWRKTGDQAFRQDLGGGFTWLTEAGGRSAREAIAKFSEQIALGKPNVERTTKGIVSTAITQLSTLGPKSRAVAQDSIVQMAISMERKGAAPKGTVNRLVKALEAKFGELPEATRKAADAAVSQLNRIGSALSDISRKADSTASALRRLAQDAREGNVTTGGATGGFIPGLYRGKDDRLMPVASGEAILTPRQQSMIPGGVSTLTRIFAATGGRIGGVGFARGGYVNNAKKFAEAQVGKGYTPGGTGAGERTGPNYWDCSGFATYVAAQVPGFKGKRGGTTFSEFGISTRAKGNEPIVYGFRDYGKSKWGTGYQHMGIRVNGVWYDAGSGGVQRGDSRWDVLRVPAGLAGLSLDTREGSHTASGKKARRQTGGFRLVPGGPMIPNSVIPKPSKPLGTFSPSSEQLDRARTQGYEVARDTGEAVAKAKGVTDAEAIRRAGDRAYIDARSADLRKWIYDAKEQRKKLIAHIDFLTKRRGEIKNAAQKRKITEAIIKHKSTIFDINLDIQEWNIELNDLTGQLVDIEAADTAANTPPSYSELDYLNASAAEATLTESNADDLASAKNIEAYWEREYAKAKVSGDPIAIANAAQGLASARATRQQIEALDKNTEAIKENTEAQFGGSTTFSYRGQSYGLRSIAMPSSDRLAGLESVV